MFYDQENNIFIEEPSEEQLFIKNFNMNNYALITEVNQNALDYAKSYTIKTNKNSTKAFNTAVKNYKEIFYYLYYYNVVDKKENNSFGFLPCHCDNLKAISKSNYKRIINHLSKHNLIFYPVTKSKTGKSKTTHTHFVKPIKINNNLLKYSENKSKYELNDEFNNYEHIFINNILLNKDTEIGQILNSALEKTHGFFNYDKSLLMKPIPELINKGNYISKYFSKADLQFNGFTGTDIFNDYYTVKYNKIVRQILQLIIQYSQISSKINTELNILKISYNEKLLDKYWNIISIDFNYKYHNNKLICKVFDKEYYTSDIKCKEKSSYVLKHLLYKKIKDNAEYLVNNKLGLSDYNIIRPLLDVIKYSIRHLNNSFYAEPVAFYMRMILEQEVEKKEYINLKTEDETYDLLAAYKLLHLNKEALLNKYKKEINKDLSVRNKVVSTIKMTNEAKITGKKENRIFTYFHFLDSDVRDCFEINGSSLTEAFDVKACSFCILAKLFESKKFIPKNIIEREKWNEEVDKFQKLVTEDYVYSEIAKFATLKFTAKIKKQIKASAQAWLNMTKIDFKNIMSKINKNQFQKTDENYLKYSVFLAIEKFFKFNFPMITNLLHDWRIEKRIKKTKTGRIKSNKISKMIWWDFQEVEYNTISKYMCNYLFKTYHVVPLTVHDALYLSKNDLNKVLKYEKIEDVFWKALNLRTMDNSKFKTSKYIRKNSTNSSDSDDNRKVLNIVYKEAKLAINSYIEKRQIFYKLPEFKLIIDSENRFT